MLRFPSVLFPNLGKASWYQEPGPEDSECDQQSHCPEENFEVEHVEVTFIPENWELVQVPAGDWPVEVPEDQPLPLHTEFAGLEDEVVLDT